MINHIILYFAASLLVYYYRQNILSKLLKVLIMITDLMFEIKWLLNNNRVNETGNQQRLAVIDTVSHDGSWLSYKWPSSDGQGYQCFVTFNNYPPYIPINTDIDYDKHYTDLYYDPIEIRLFPEQYKASSKQLNTITTLMGPEQDFKIGGKPSLNQIKSYALLDPSITKVIITNSNYEEFIIE